MKTLILIAVTFFTTSSFASTVEFRKNSVLPRKVQEAIAGKIASQCKNISARGWPVSELKTEATQSYIDATESDYTYYKTEMLVEGMDNDNMHPYSFKMSVNSVLGQNQLQVSIVEGCR